MRFRLYAEFLLKPTRDVSQLVSTASVGVLRLLARSRAESPKGSGRIVASEQTINWNAAETAVIAAPNANAASDDIHAPPVAVGQAN